MSTAPIPNIALATFYTAGTYTNDPLLADGHDVTSRKGTIASGAGKLYRGQILNIVPATGVIATAVLGTAAPNCVLAENIDATSATVEALVYLTGRMKADAVIWPPTGGHADITDVLRDCGIYLESVLFRDGTIAKSVPTKEEESEARKHLDARKHAEEAAAKKAPEKGEEPPPPSDSSWQYMTAEERAEHPEFAEPVPEADVDKEKEDKDKEDKEKKHPPPPQQTPPHREPPKR